MLREIRNVKQERGAGRRRWFESDGLDLIVWLNRSGGRTGFQVCYDFGKGEHALTWRPVGGFVHHRVDAGDTSPLKNESPILVHAGAVPWVKLRKIFGERSETLEPELREWVEAALGEGAAAR